MLLSLVQVAHPYNSSKTIFLFSHNVNTSVQQIAWAAGPFHVYPMPTEHLDDVSATQTLMHAFCLPGHEPQLVSSVTFLRSAMNFYQSDLGSYPFNSHKLVFVDELPTQRFDSSTLSLVTVDLLHGEDAIDQVYETRLALSHALACQWVGINIQPKTASDTWLTNGLGLYVAGLFYKKMFGANDHRYRLKKDMLRVLELDNGNMPPVCQPQNLEPPDGAVLSFICLKSPLILHILDRRLTKSGTSLGLSRVLPKIFLSAISGDLGNNALSTHAFLRICRKVSGMDPRTFAEQWIYGSGFPAFQFQASFNRKKMAVEIRMRQECPAYKLRENDEVAKTLFKPVPFFEVGPCGLYYLLLTVCTGPDDYSYP
jgi:transcription initiation factor TFIID subunit 2